MTFCQQPNYTHLGHAAKLNFWKNCGFGNGHSGVIGGRRLPSLWYEITFTVGLHDNQVFYSGFQAGNVNSLTSFTRNHTYNAPASSTAAAIVPAMQIDDNTQDTQPPRAHKKIVTWPNGTLIGPTNGRRPGSRRGWSV